MRAWKVCLASIALGAACAAAAQDPAYPSRPIRWIVPYTPGGITDTVTRLVAAKLQESAGQPVIVENKPGANSIVGADLAAKSPADGYTVLTVIAAHAVNATLYAGKLPFDAVRSFTPVSLVAVAPLILTVNNDFPARDVKGLIEYARANPGRISFGSSGVGAAAHLTTELLKQSAGLDMVHVPYKGTAPALAALMAGDIQVLVDVPSSMMPHVRAGRVKALGLFASKRIEGAAEVPTLSEAGGPPLDASTWLLILVPAGTPHAAVSRLSSEIARILALPEMRERLSKLGIDPVGSPPDHAARFLGEEIAKWAKVIEAANIKADP
jgi:tripartite-type tricarboxylate transporter receptor subunit TctC